MQDKQQIVTDSPPTKTSKPVVTILLVFGVICGVSFFGIKLYSVGPAELSRIDPLTSTNKVTSLVLDTQNIMYEGEKFTCITKLQNGNQIQELVYSNKSSEDFQTVREQCQPRPLLR